MEPQRQSECPSLKRLSAACRKEEDGVAVLIPTCEERRADRRSAWSKLNKGPSASGVLRAQEVSLAGTGLPLSVGLWPAGVCCGHDVGATRDTQELWGMALFPGHPGETEVVRGGPRTPSLESHPCSEDAGICLSHPDAYWGLMGQAVLAVCARPQGRGLCLSVPDHRVGSEPARCRPQCRAGAGASPMLLPTLLVPSSSFQSAQELLWRVLTVSTGKNCGSDKMGWD